MSTGQKFCKECHLPLLKEDSNGVYCNRHSIKHPVRDLLYVGELGMNVKFENFSIHTQADPITNKVNLIFNDGEYRVQLEPDEVRHLSRMFAQFFANVVMDTARAGKAIGEQWRSLLEFMK